MSRRKRHRRSFYRAYLSASWSGFVSGNQVTLLQNGEAYFPAIEAAIDQAMYEIYLETYIYQNDATGQRIADALVRATLRGVKIYMLIDGYGSKDLPRSMHDYLRASGVNLLIFKPRISIFALHRTHLRRMHRKIVVIDREIAFVGGINIINDRDGTDDKASRYDYAVAVTGPLVDVIRLSAQRLWSQVAWRSFHKGTARGGELSDPTTAGGSMNAAFLKRDNFRHRHDIEAAYLRAIKLAKSEIILAHAYFLPGHNFRHALIKAAGRGVRVILLLQGKVEYFLEHHGSRALYGNFLDAGIEIYEYRKSFLHAKVATIDGHWATVGSSNIDPFSLLLSREANVVVEDETFAATLTQSLKTTISKEGHQILAENWKQQPIGLRFISWLSYGVLRMLIGLTGHAREYERTGNE
jgi:cardiolipin synthase A/B